VARPRLYRLATRLGMRALRVMAGGKGKLRSLPLAGGWTGERDLPAPEGRTFMDQWKAMERRGRR
jgi:L-lactate dehydrogenase complex protein LldF